LYTESDQPNTWKPVQANLTSPISPTKNRDGQFSQVPDIRMPATEPFFGNREHERVLC